MAQILKFENKREFKISCKADDKDKAEMILYAPIGGGYYDGISAKAISDEINKLPKTLKSLTIRVNSPGGDVFDGVAIYNRLKQLKVKKTVYVDGLAASIASIIAMAGDEIIMGEGALMMVHKPWTFAMGDSEELEKTIFLLDEIEEQMVGIYSYKTGLTRFESRELLKNGGTWLNADDAIAKGFATSKMEQDEKLDIAACVEGCRWLRNTPKMERVASKIIEDFQKQIEGYLAR